MKPKKCEWCGKYIYEMTNKNIRYCSRECAAQANYYNRQKAEFDSKSLEQVAEEAAAAGMSYGEYTAKHLTDLIAYRRKYGHK